MWARDICAETAKWKGRDRTKKSIYREVETRNWGLLRARTGVATISSYQRPVAEKANLLRPTKRHEEQKPLGQGLIRILSFSGFSSHDAGLHILPLDVKETHVSSYKSFSSGI